ncbi:MAG: glycosyltransferase family 4 protein [Thaumarchaeota archaeon]|nr:glycosyltransferase family 4 protein [Nitrososphaerota archaeon]MCL5318545.1 glycosyltransferase family 4 protein [Nitrososphaerota archaeon]
MGGLNIGIVVDRVMPYYIGGYERRYWELARRLAENNEVHIFTSCPQSETIEQVNIHKVAAPKPYFNDKGYRILHQDLGFTLRYLSKFEKMDVIDCNATPFIHLPLMTLAAKYKRTKIAVTVHEVLQKTVNTYLYYRYQNPVQRKLIPVMSSIGSRIIKASLTHPKPDLTIAVSETTKQMLENIGLNHVSLIPNGVNATNLAKSIKEDAETDVVFIGRLSPEKRVEDLLESLRYLKQQYGVISKSKIVGNGPLQKKLAAKADMLGVSDYVQFTGQLSEQELQNTLKTSRIFVLPSAREGFSIATAEAMANGLPVIMAVPPVPEEAGGALNLIDNGANGLTYPLGNIAELADRIMTLLKDDKLRSNLGTASHQKAAQFNWDNIAKTYEETLTKIVEGRLA